MIPAPEQALRRLRAGMLAFFLAVSLPFVLLVWQAYRQLEFETFFEYRSRAEALLAAVDRDFATAARSVQALRHEDFHYFGAPEDGSGLLRSPLSEWPPAGELPGVEGYFRISEDGGFSTPHLPSDSLLREAQLPAAELEARQAGVDRLRSLLAASGDPRPPSAPMPSLPAEADEAEIVVTGALRETLESDDFAASQAAVSAEEERGLSRYVADAFRGRDADDVPSADSLGKLEDIDFNDQLEIRSQRLERNRALSQRRLDVSNAELQSAESLPAERQLEPDMQALIAAPDETDFRLLPDGKGMLFRRTRVNGANAIQGAVVDVRQMLLSIVEARYAGSSLPSIASLFVAVDDDVVAILGPESRAGRLGDIAGTLLHRSRPSPPFDRIRLVVAAERLPEGPGGTLLSWVGALFAVVLVAGCLLLYRTGMRQIALTAQQRDFVSAVSHELKTPLTSIRLYGELLSSGWADDTRRQQYYEYIQDESERLTRLIDNVLRLSRITRGGNQLDLRPVSAAELADLLRSRVAPRGRDADVDVDVACDAQAAGARVAVDTDAFLQIGINLVDNALKFGRPEQSPGRIDCRLALSRRGTLDLTVRDFGPGIPSADAERIFELFRRSDDPASRERSGTGIGLGIVKLLAEDMSATVSVVNRDPGAEFSVRFPLIADDAPAGA